MEGEKLETVSKQILELYKVPHNSRMSGNDDEDDGHSEPDKNTLIQIMNKNLRMNEKVSDVRHGDRYSMYKSIDHLPEKLRLFMEAAASVISLSAEQLVPTVRLLEKECILLVIKKDGPVFAEELVGTT